MSLLRTSQQSDSCIWVCLKEKDKTPQSPSLAFFVVLFEMSWICAHVQNRAYR